ncbi:CLUMA_CG015312, isoform A [Clunio marinus]|uniref:CLUMA_CG015312, isoform A n=1 Tax=Clunio marinus TaxID=568069 RepID=A0A1J1ITY0_9DIPT|nr:CLUMA_CG015312, isoform A [Clunio marinus]
MEELLQFLSLSVPIKFKNVFGFDVSEKMLKFARENYGNDVTKFHQFDINQMEYFSNDLLLEKCGIKYQSADIVTSFLCLQWIKDLKKAFYYIGKLIKPGGFLVMNMAKNVPALTEAYIEVSQREKYLQFKSDAKVPIFSLKDVEDPCRMLNELLKDANFDVKFLECVALSKDFENRSNFHDMIKSVYTLSPRMSKEMQNEFYIDLFDCMETSIDQSNGGYVFSYDYLYLIAVKND